jgi:hypothetical protein
MGILKSPGDITGLEASGYEMILGYVLGIVEVDEAKAGDSIKSHDQECTERRDREWCRPRQNCLRASGS